LPQTPSPDVVSGHTRRVTPISIAVFAALAALAGCATQPDGSRWGEHAGFRVGWDRTAAAALQAARSPWVWAPLAGAAVMQVDNWDHRVSDWAVDNTPVFGSVTGASDASDILQVSAGVGYLASVLATPSGDAGPDWWSAKLNGGLVGLGAIAATSVVTEGLKVAVGRERPNGGSNSFPSGHTSFAAVADTMTVRNLASIPMNDTARTALTIGADALTFATGWARVEAGAHYPSDVLVGMSIGNFFGQMFDDAFLGDDLSQRLSLSFEPARGGGEIAWNWRF
jgi:membrane-associated phospholipid phosphatase